MRSLKWLTLAVAAAMLLATSAVAAEAEKNASKAKAKPKKDALRGEYAIMASECKLTPEQQAQVREKLKARNAWQQANGEKVKALREASKKARQAKDEDAAAKARAALEPLQLEQRKIQQDTMAQLLAILTPEQKATWETFRVYRRAMFRYRRIDLTDDQRSKARQAAADAAKQLGALSGDEKELRKAQRDIEDKLHQTIEEQVLTAEQRDALKKQADNEPRPEKKGEAKAKT